MNGEFIFMRLLAVCAAERDIRLLREAASFASIPTEFSAVVSARGAHSVLKLHEIDVVLVEHAIMQQDPELVRGLRAARPSLVVLAMASKRDEAVKLVAAETEVDGVVVKPATLENARAVAERCTKFKIPTPAEVKRRHPHIGVIMMTSAQDAALAERARAAGAVALLRKPFYPGDVDAVLFACHGLRPR